ncbi:MAG: YqcI/YcgG family protein [Pelagibacterales bacterium]|nr:YqcI/YcgG family protein [Pelagibacterales bacterium]
MLDADTLKHSNQYLFNTLEEFFNSKEKEFTCLYAIRSFNKHEMQFGLSDSRDFLVRDISKNLNKISMYLDSNRSEQSKQLATYLHIYVGNDDINNVEEFLVELLQGLHKVDKCQWPIKYTKNMNDPKFEFHFNSHIWFPILLTPNHPSKARQSPFTFIAFQPGVTFDHNKNNNSFLYSRMRKSIHNRIDGLYENDRPYYLSEKSSGKNIIQYIGHDPKEFNKNHCFPYIG